MTQHKIVSKDAWIEARKQLLAKEKKFTHQREKLSADRRNLPWVKIEKDLGALLPPERWMAISSELIYLGREFCPARKPKCVECPVKELCPKIGVVA